MNLDEALGRVRLLQDYPAMGERDREALVLVLQRYDELVDERRCPYGGVEHHATAGGILIPETICGETSKIRDQFAAAALTGAISKAGSGSAESYAEWAYDLADAMLVKREGKPEAVLSPKED